MIKTFLLSLAAIFLLLSAVKSSGQAVGIGTSSPNTSSVLDVTSTSKGMLVPRMTQAQRNAIASPATGLLIYQTDNSPGFYYYSITWKPLASSSVGVDTLNIFYGNHSGDSIKSGIHNTAIGNLSLQYITTGGRNTVVGHESLNANTVGNENAALGAGALIINDSGNYNTACGNGSLPNNTSGSYNTGVGYWSLFLQNGQNNAALGFSAGDFTTGTTEGTFLGTLTQANNNLSNVTAIGYNAKVTSSNSVRVGNGSVTSIGGQVSWSSFSDGRFKKDVMENVPGLTFINKLRPVTYKLDVNNIDNAFERTGSSTMNAHKRPEPIAKDIKAKEEKSRIIYTGFIAQEVEIAANDVHYNFSGVDAPKNKDDFYGLRYSEFVTPLVKAVQELSKINEEKDLQIQLQNQKIAALEKRMLKLEEMVLDRKTINTN